MSENFSSYRSVYLGVETILTFMLIFRSDFLKKHQTNLTEKQFFPKQHQHSAFLCLICFF
jgi:hypothetical protein